MAKTIKVRHGIGDDVKHFTGIDGRMTAIFHRGGKNSYEVSYARNGVEPSCCVCEECELESEADGKPSIGFNHT